MFAQESFEGKITYKVDIEFNEKNHYLNDYFSKKWGATMKGFHYKLGFGKRIYKNSLNVS